MHGKLIICPTPLGNLEDITLRALRVLRESNVVFAEDTRVTQKLLNYYGIKTRIRSFHQRVQARRIRELGVYLQRDETVAVVSDAGTPGISDPGSDLVVSARQFGADVEALPGPSALVGALVLSGFDIGKFRFEGFPPRKAAARQTYLRGFAVETSAVVWYEAPSRILDLLTDIESTLRDRRLFLLREYTKKFEQHALGTAAEIKLVLNSPPRGEFVMVLEGTTTRLTRELAPDNDISKAMSVLLAQDVSVNVAVDVMRKATGQSRNELYRLAQRLKAP